MLVVKKRGIKRLFKGAGKRVPVGFVSAVDTLISAIVDNAVNSGKGSIVMDEVIALGKKSECQMMSEHIHLAYLQLEKEGKLDQGLLLGRAKQLQIQGLS